MAKIADKFHTEEWYALGYNHYTLCVRWDGDGFAPKIVLYIKANGVVNEVLLYIHPMGELSWTDSFRFDDRESMDSAIADIDEDKLREIVDNKRKELRGEV